MSEKAAPLPSGVRRDARAAADAWLRQRRRATLVLITAAALALRAVCFVELAASPFLWWHEWDLSDMHTFHTWALSIAGGDWWSRTVRVPVHDWHRQIARDYARLFPQQWARLVAAAPDVDEEAAVRALWERWCGAGRTYHAPLYAYLVAVIYRLLGPAVGWVFGLQMLAGTGSVLLVYLIARRHFGDLAAVAAAVLTLLYGPLLFYEFTLLRDSLVVFLGLLLVELLDRASARRTARCWLASGLALGLAIALKSHFLLMGLAAAGLLVAQCRRHPRKLAACGALLATGLALSLGPLVVRNRAVGAPAFTIDANGAVTFLIANAADSDCVSWETRYAAPVLAASDGRFLPTVIATLKTHPSVLSYLRLLGTKALATWYWYESPNNANFYCARLHSALLDTLPVSFGLIGPLALVGLVLTMRHPGRCAPLLCLVLANLIVLHVFFVFDRFRIALAAALLPLAGLTVARLVELAAARRAKPALLTAVACALPAVYTLSPTIGGGALTRPADVQVGYMVYYDPRVQAALSRGDVAAAADVLAESLQHQPPEVRALGPHRPALSIELAQLGGIYAGVHSRHADLLAQLGRTAEAEAQQRRALELWQASEPALRRQRAMPAESH